MFNLHAMKYIFQIVLIMMTRHIYAQSQPDRNIKTPISHTVDFKLLPNESSPYILNLKPMPQPSVGIQQTKQRLMDLKLAKSKAQYSNKTDAGNVAMPIYVAGYSGNYAGGTPNDNSIAVSNGGKVISAANSNIRIYNDTNSKQLSIKALGGMASSVGSLTRTYDPKVIYDPNTDRFILVFLNGTTSFDNNIIVCFTQTNDPVGKWNCYKLPGTKEGDSSWSDYPIISITKEDLFITVNKLHNNMGWKDGFIKSVIWQVRMKEGFNGDSLVSNYFANNVYGGKSLWSICPIQGGIEPTNPFQYLLTVRPADAINDSVFLYKIDNTVSSGKANISVKYIKTNKTYGLPPSAIQPTGNQILETNDCRVLSGIYENGVIQYCQTSIDTNTYNSSIYHGVIYDPDGNPTIQANLIKSDTLDFAYPSIAYSGEGTTDHGAIITFSYVNPRVYPGTAAVYVDRDLKGYSDLLICKKGEGAINVLVDTAERWGDYTGIQRKYNEKGVCWLNGSWGDINGGTRTWIAKVKSTDPKLVLEQMNNQQQTFDIYPNPSSEMVNIDFNVNNTEVLTFNLYTLDGKLVKSIYYDLVKPGINRFSFNAQNYSKGIYILKIENKTSTIFFKKIVLQ
jgi:hypothetical protein